MSATDLSEPWARRTERLDIQLTKVGLAQGGLPGSRLTQHLSVKISHQTLLRLVMKMPNPSHPIPKVLGLAIEKLEVNFSSLLAKRESFFFSAK